MHDPANGKTVELTAAEAPRVAIVVGDAPGDEDAAKLLANKAAEIAGVALPLVSPGEPDAGLGRVHVGTLSEGSAATEALRLDHAVVNWTDREQEEYKRLNIPADLGPEGYVFHATGAGNGLVLGGHTAQGTLYSAVTAGQRLILDGGRLVIPHIDTPLQPRLNMPLFPHRSVATNLGGPDWIAPARWENEWGLADGTYDWKGFVDFLVEHKINNLNAWIFNLAWGIAYNSDRFPEMVNPYHPNVRHEFMKELIEYAKGRGIDTWLFLDFPENWAGIIRKRPHLAGKNVDLENFPQGEAWESYLRGDETSLAVRKRVGWVCGDEPDVMNFWLEYLDELLDRYPSVRGIGGQFGESMHEKCDCGRCSTGYFDVQEEYFARMVEVAHSKDPAIVPWVYDSLGSREIIRAAEKYPHFINVDWGSAQTWLKFESRRQVPRSDWYMQHAYGRRWQESMIRRCTRVLSSMGQTGYQLRVLDFKSQDELYHAVQEFTWNPDLDDDDFARLHIMKRYHRDDAGLSNLYATWIRISGAHEELSRGESDGWTDFADVSQNLGRDVVSLDSMLAGVSQPDGFVSDIAHALETNRAELDEISK
jgi:hypothetical protein